MVELCSYGTVVTNLDPGQALAGGALDRRSIGYVTFLNDLEQDVTPVASGYCVTLTLTYHRISTMIGVLSLGKVRSTKIKMNSVKLSK
jgi:hypothetical protein